MDLSELFKQIDEENNKFWAPFLEQMEKEREELVKMMAEINKETDNLLLEIAELDLTF